MQLNPSVFDVWVFRRARGQVEFLLLQTSQIKADRYFNGGRFWQIPSGAFESDESVPNAIDRLLAPHGLPARRIWAGEHTYTIYNRRFNEVQLITVFAAETDSDIATIRLDPEEHSSHEWLSYSSALERVHFRGLKDGLRSVHEYITSIDAPAAELQLR